MMDEKSPLESLRLQFVPELPQVMEDILKLDIKRGQPTSSAGHDDQLKQLFPRTFGQPIVEFFQSSSHDSSPGSSDGSSTSSRGFRVGVVFSGGQAPGGHNVVSGLYDGIKKIDKRSSLIGFLNGPAGIVSNQFKEIREDQIDAYRNLGGFDLIGSGRTKIETQEQLAACLNTVKGHQLDGLVVIGGDDSNTNAAILAEYFFTQDCKTCVVGCPKTIDGDLKNAQIETSFGFDTASKVYSELIGNICKDALSSRKYYHFVKLMGRSASHITLECALQTHPNLTFIGEEVLACNITLEGITHSIVEMIRLRSLKKKDFGVILLPEGVIEFIPEVKQLISDLNHNASELDALESFEEKKKRILQLFSADSSITFQQLPGNIQQQLLLERDPHGNVQVSHIETEQLLISNVKRALKKLKSEGKYQGKFNPVAHFFGYEGRSGFPSNFDANYCYALGQVAASLIHHDLSGYMACFSHLHLPPRDWQPQGIPITMLMNLEKREGVLKPVIQKALVDLKGAPFTHFQKERQQWIEHDLYRCPGPIQFSGPKGITDAITMTLQLETAGY